MAFSTRFFDACLTFCTWSTNQFFVTKSIAQYTHICKSFESSTHTCKYTYK